VLVSTLGCKDAATGPERVAPVGVRVSVSDATLASLGDTLRITAVAVDANGTTLPDIPLRWRVERAGIVDTVAGGTFFSVANGQVRVWAELAFATGGIERGVGYDDDVAAADLLDEFLGRGEPGDGRRWVGHDHIASALAGQHSARIAGVASQPANGRPTLIGTQG
jgi:hypothetical protein